METFKLLSLGAASNEKIHACGAAIGLIDRERGQKVIDSKRQKELEDLGGLAILKALTEFDFPDGEPAYTKEVLDVINAHEKKETGKVKTMAIERIRADNPQLFEGAEPK